MPKVTQLPTLTILIISLFVFAISRTLSLLILFFQDIFNILLSVHISNASSRSIVLNLPDCYQIIMDTGKCCFSTHIMTHIITSIIVSDCTDINRKFYWITQNTSFFLIGGKPLIWWDGICGLHMHEEKYSTVLVASL